MLLAARYVHPLNDTGTLPLDRFMHSLDTVLSASIEKIDTEMQDQFFGYDCDK